MKVLTLISTILIFGLSAVNAEAACDQRVNPHAFECHHDAFINRGPFPLVELDWDNVIQDEWFVTTFAIPAGNAGEGFVMDANPARPTLPGRGVFNNHGNGQFSIMGSMWINGDQIHFDNWQGAPMQSTPGSLQHPDAMTFQFDAIDRFRIGHRFQCRDFVRNENHHLTCNWFIWTNLGWKFNGYFGFVTRQVWDDFINRGPR